MTLICEKTEVCASEGMTMGEFIAEKIQPWFNESNGDILGEDYVFGIDKKWEEGIRATDPATA